MTDERPPSAPSDGLRDRFAAATSDERDPEAEKWRSDLAARLFGEPPREVKIGRYTVLSRVGGGATGVVYAAHDPQLDRKVALKVLRSDVALPPQRAEQWLAREAKILARLSHPNVVPVYDVGEDGGRLFIALELVQGHSLRTWLATTRRVSEVVEVFVQAGRGLAAAHAAGLVHRDFKPENVLLGDDGRVRVSDFGIARRLGPSPDEVAQTEASGEAIPPPSAGTSMTTHHGAGTPGYMAPEQFLGDPVDARTDQFGFCVALHEALYGERPFPGSTRTGLAANVIAGRRRAPPRGHLVPRWLEKVVARGLQIDPERRYPSMDALLVDLERRRSGRTRWLLGVAVIAGLTGAAVMDLGTDVDDPCRGAKTKLAAVWSPTRADEIETAFRATELPYAVDSARRVRESLDGYGRDWVQAHDQACEGASEEAVMERMYCLQSRLLELGSLTDLLRQADERVVEHAVASAASLVAPAECVYVGAHVRSGDGGDDEPAERSELRLEIARAKVLGDTGRPQQARTIARMAASQARDLDDRTLEAEALLVAAHVERGLLGVIERNDAELTTHSAVLAAEAAHRPDLLARGLVEYLEVTVSLGRIEQTRKWERRAREAVKAVGSPPALMGRIEYAMALASSFGGHSEEARASAERARALFVEGGVPARRWSATAENLLGELDFAAGRYAAALPHYERALDIATEEMGPEHAWVASAHGNMAEIFYLSGQYDQATEHFEIALRIREAVYGPTSVWVIHTLAHLGDLALVRGQPDQALALYGRALDGRAQLRAMAGDRPSDEDAQMLAVYRDLQAWDQDQWLHYGMALALLELGRVDEARVQTQLVPEPRLPDDHHHPDQICRLDVPGLVTLADGGWAEAIAELEQAFDRMEDELGPRHRCLAFALWGLGEAHLQQGEPDQARPALERALRILDAMPEAFEPRLRGDLHFGLARAVAGWPGRLDEARELAERARADYLSAPTPWQVGVDEIDAWRARLPGAPTAD